MNSSITTLAEIVPGQSAQVKQLHLTGSIRHRLLDLGLIEGTRIECVCKSPAGDPMAYLIRGAVVALRRIDCQKIEVI